MNRGRGAAILQLELLVRSGSLAGLSDHELLERMAAPNRALASAAFETLVHRHGPMVLATCRGALRNEHDAEDAFQATFLVMVRRIGSLRSRECLGPWLHRVALRAAARVRFAAARERDRVAHLAERTVMAPPHTDGDAQREELRRVIHQEIERLPQRYRVVVVLCDLESESYETAAGRLRVPIGTIRSRLSRARERLRSQIVRRGLALPAGVATAILPASEASAAVPPALITATLKLVDVSATAGRLAANSAAARYAEEVLSGGFGGFPAAAKVAAWVAVVGVGLSGAYVGMHAGRTQSPAGEVMPQAPLLEPSVSAANHGALPRSDRDQLQGRWTIVEAQQQGDPLDIVVGDHLLIQGDEFGWTAARGEPERIFGRGTTNGTISIDATADPRAIDFNDSRRTIRAIYQIEGGGDRLRLCVGDPDAPSRPRLFNSEPRTRRLHLVFRLDPPSSPRSATSKRSGSAAGKERR
jgi:RNA polymerase sigma factor (sigma-70 family)